MINIKSYILTTLIVFLLFIFLTSCMSASDHEEAQDTASKAAYFYGSAPSDNNDDTHIFYTVLPNNDKYVYEMFLDLVENKDVPDYELTLYVDSEKYPEISLTHLWNIYYAMFYDHPEFFFLLTGDEPRVRAYTDDVDGYKELRFSLTEAPQGENEMVAELESAAENFLSEIKFTDSDEKNELLIHDKLIELVSYDYDLYEADKSSTYCGLASTAYGALVQNDNHEKNTALCGGYALAFEYLCQKAGIPCGYITGMADANIEENEGYSFHAWNIVKLDDAYYETDPTWDDFDISDKVSDEELIDLITSDRDVYSAVTHHYYNLTTAQMEYIDKKEATTFYLEGYNPYNPRLVSSHIRGTYSLGKTDDISMYLNSLLPEAMGK